VEKAEYFPGIFADIRVLYLFALSTCPFEEVVPDLLPALCLFLVIAETLLDGFKVS
jgi:hypothetical protein